MKLSAVNLKGDEKKMKYLTGERKQGKGSTITINPVQQLKELFDKCPNDRRSKAVERCCFNFPLIETKKQMRILTSSTCDLLWKL